MINEFYEQQQAVFEEQITEFYKQKKRILVTSTFQSHSIPLLHRISMLPFKIPVILIDTGYLFPETHLFAKQVCDRFQLELVKFRSKFSLLEHVCKPGMFLHSIDTDRCCFANKVSVLRDCYSGYDIWISGIRRDQSSVRSSKNVIEVNDDGIIRYHPMLDWNSKLIHEYKKKWDLPDHPLESHGFLSVGCMPCSSTYNEQMEKDVRIFQMGRSKEN